jgi:predicted Zn-ribbon and HTH transcriptional regulator
VLKGLTSQKSTWGESQPNQPAPTIVKELTHKQIENCQLCYFATATLRRVKFTSNAKKCKKGILWYNFNPLTDFHNQHRVLLGRTTAFRTPKCRSTKIDFRGHENAKSTKRGFCDIILTHWPIFTIDIAFFLGETTAFRTPKCRSTKIDKWLIRRQFCRVS